MQPRFAKISAVLVIAFLLVAGAPALGSTVPTLPDPRPEVRVCFTATNVLGQNLDGIRIVAIPSATDNAFNLVEIANGLGQQQTPGRSAVTANGGTSIMLHKTSYRLQLEDTLGPASPQRNGLVYVADDTTTGTFTPLDENVVPGGCYNGQDGVVRNLRLLTAGQSFLEVTVTDAVHFQQRAVSGATIRGTSAAIDVATSGIGARTGPDGKVILPCVTGAPNAFVVGGDAYLPQLLQVPATSCVATGLNRVSVSIWRTPVNVEYRMSGPESRLDDLLSLTVEPRLPGPDAPVGGPALSGPLAMGPSTQAVAARPEVRVTPTFPFTLPVDTPTGAAPTQGPDGDGDGVPATLLVPMERLTIHENGDVERDPAPSATIAVDPDDGDPANPAPQLFPFPVPAPTPSGPPTLGPDEDGDGVPSALLVPREQLTIQADGRTTSGPASEQAIPIDTDDDEESEPVPLPATFPADTPSGAPPTMGVDADGDGIPATISIPMERVTIGHGGVVTRAPGAAVVLTLDTDDGDATKPVPLPFVIPVPLPAGPPVFGPDVDGDLLPAYVEVPMQSVTLTRSGPTAAAAPANRIQIDANDASADLPLTRVAVPGAVARVTARPAELGQAAALCPPAPENAAPVEARAVPLVGSANSPYLCEANADSEGRATLVLPWLELQDWAVALSAPGYVGVNRAESIRGVHVTVDRERHRLVEIVLVKTSLTLASTASTRALDIQGPAIQGAVVEFYEPSSLPGVRGDTLVAASLPSGADGHWTLDGQIESGTYNVVYTATGSEPHRCTGVVGVLGGNVGSLTLTPSNCNVLVDTGRAGVTGRVFDHVKTTLGIPGLDVCLGSAQTQCDTTGPDGTFQLEVTPNSNLNAIRVKSGQVWQVKFQGATGSADSPITGTAPAAGNVMELPSSLVAVRAVVQATVNVRDEATNNPIAGANIEVRRGSTLLTSSDPTKPADNETNAQGNFVVPTSLSPSFWNVHPTLPEFNSQDYFVSAVQFRAAGPSATHHATSSTFVDLHSTEVASGKTIPLKLAVDGNTWTFAIKSLDLHNNSDGNAIVRAEYDGTELPPPTVGPQGLVNTTTVKQMTLYAGDGTRPYKICVPDQDLYISSLDAEIACTLITPQTPAPVIVNAVRKTIDKPVAGFDAHTRFDLAAYGVGARAPGFVCNPKGVDTRERECTITTNPSTHVGVIKIPWTSRADELCIAGNPGFYRVTAFDWPNQQNSQATENHGELANFQEALICKLWSLGDTTQVPIDPLRAPHNATLNGTITQLLGAPLSGVKLQAKPDNVNFTCQPRFHNSSRPWDVCGAGGIPASGGTFAVQVPSTGPQTTWSLTASATGHYAETYNLWPLVANVTPRDTVPTGPVPTPIPGNVVVPVEGLRPKFVLYPTQFDAVIEVEDFDGLASEPHACGLSNEEYPTVLVFGTDPLNPKTGTATPGANGNCFAPVTITDWARAPQPMPAAANTPWPKTTHPFSVVVLHNGHNGGGVVPLGPGSNDRSGKVQMVHSPNVDEPPTLFTIGTPASDVRPACDGKADRVCFRVGVDVTVLGVPVLQVIENNVDLDKLPLTLPATPTGAAPANGPDADGDGLPAYVDVPMHVVTIQEDGTTSSAPAPAHRVPVDPNDASNPLPLPFTLPADTPTGAPPTMGPDTDKDGIPDYLEIPMERVTIGRDAQGAPQLQRQPSQPVHVPLDEALPPVPGATVEDGPFTDVTPNCGAADRVCFRIGANVTVNGQTHEGVIARDASAGALPLTLPATPSGAAPVAGPDADGDGVPAWFDVPMQVVTIQKDGSTSSAPAPAQRVPADNDDTSNPNPLPFTLPPTPAGAPTLGPDADGDGLPAHLDFPMEVRTIQRDGTTTSAPSPSQRVPVDPDDANSPLPLPFTLPADTPTGAPPTMGPDTDGDGIPEYMEIPMERVTIARDGPLLKLEREPRQAQRVALDETLPDPTVKDGPFADVTPNCGAADRVCFRIGANVTVNGQTHEGVVARDASAGALPLTLPATPSGAAPVAGPDADGDGVPAWFDVPMQVVTIQKDGSTSSAPAPAQRVPADNDDTSNPNPLPFTLPPTPAGAPTLGPDADGDGVPDTLVVPMRVLTIERDGRITEQPAPPQTTPVDPTPPPAFVLRGQIFDSDAIASLRNVPGIGATVTATPHAASGCATPAPVRADHEGKYVFPLACAATYTITVALTTGVTLWTPQPTSGTVSASSTTAVADVPAPRVRTLLRVVPVPVVHLVKITPAGVDLAAPLPQQTIDGTPWTEYASVPWGTYLIRAEAPGGRERTTPWFVNPTSNSGLFAARVLATGPSAV